MNMKVVGTGYAFQQEPTPSPLLSTAASFSRPADVTAYASGDLVANSVTAGSVVVPFVVASRGIDLPGLLQRCKLTKSGSSITTASFRVHFYTSLPTVANGDNAAWSTSEAGYVGSMDVTMDRAFTNGAVGRGIPTEGSFLAFAPVVGTDRLYFLIEARSAYTPVSGETFTLSVAGT